MRLSPGRPAALLGVRTAIVTVLPLLATPLLGLPTATWMSTAGFTVALADKGGAYPARALVMGGVTLGGALAVTAAGLASSHAGAAIPLTFVWIALALMAGVYGAAAAGAGTTVSVLFVISLAYPIAPSHAWQRGAAVLAGGAWAMSLALLFWPVRVYKPARFAVARCFRALASQLTELGHLAALGRSGRLARPATPGSAGGTERFQTSLLAGHAQIRAAIESARATLLATRRGRRGESGRGARLLVLLQMADQMLAALVSLEDALDGALHAAPDERVQRELEQATAELSSLLLSIATQIEAEAQLPAASVPALALDRLREALRALDPPAPVRLEYQHALELLDALRRVGEQAARTAATLYDDRPLPLTDDALVLGADEQARSLVEPLRENFDRESSILRHALRVAVVAATAVALTRALHLGRGHWVTITVIILLQQHAPATFTKGLQRIAGTVAGGVLAALIAAWVHDERIILGLALVLAGASAAVLQLNYALYSFFLTPTFVLWPRRMGGIAAWRGCASSTRCWAERWPSPAPGRCGPRASASGSPRPWRPRCGGCASTSTTWCRPSPAARPSMHRSSPPIAATWASRSTTPTPRSRACSRSRPRTMRRSRR